MLHDIVDLLACLSSCKPNFSESCSPWRGAKAAHAHKSRKGGVTRGLQVITHSQMQND